MVVSGLLMPAAIVAGGSVAVAGTVLGVRYMVRLGQFSYQNARLSASGNPYVRRDELFPLVESGSPQNLVKSIQGPFAMQITPGSFREADKALLDSFSRAISALEEDSPSPARPLIKAMTRRYEAQEIKRLLRSVGRTAEPLSPIGSVDADLERQVLGSKGLSQAMEVLEYHPVGSRLKPLVQSGSFTYNDVDMALDAASIAPFIDTGDLPLWMRKGARSLGDLLGDVHNVNLMLRAKGAALDRESVMAQSVPLGTLGPEIVEQMADARSVHEAVQALAGTELETMLKEHDDPISVLDRALGRLLLKGSVDMGTRYFSGIGPTVRYVISLEMEMRNLRTVLLAAYSGWDHERTRSRLIFEEGEH